MYDAVQSTDTVLYLKVYVVEDLSMICNQILGHAAFASCSYYIHVLKATHSSLIYVAWQGSLNKCFSRSFTTPFWGSNMHLQT